MKIIEDSDGELLFECNECLQLKEELVEFDLDGEGDDNCDIAEICEDCLKKALEMLTGKKL